MFIKNFNENKYIPELLFDNPEIIGRIKNHLMILWKISNSKTV